MADRLAADRTGEREPQVPVWSALLSVFSGDEAAPARSGDDQAFIPQGGQDLAGGGLGDAVFLVDRHNAGDHRAGSQLARQDLVPQDVPDLHPWRDMALAVRHGPTLPGGDKPLPATACYSTLYCVMS